MRKLSRISFFLSLTAYYLNFYARFNNVRKATNFVCYLQGIKDFSRTFRLKFMPLVTFIIILIYGKVFHFNTVNIFEGYIYLNH